MLTGEVRVVPIEKVSPPDVLLRTVNKNTERYRELLKDIADKGLINIPMAKPGEEPGTYKMVEGNHRYSCAMDLGWKEITIQVRENLTPADELKIQISGNAQVIPTARGDYAKQIAKYMTMNPTMTKAEVAAELKKSEKWLEDMLSLTNLYSQAFDLVNKGTINAVNATALAKLPQEEQVNFLENAITEKTDVFSGMVDSRLKEIRDARRKGRAPGEAEFKPTAHCRTTKEGEEERRLKTAFVTANPQTPAEAWDAAIAWFLHLDPASVEEQRAKWEKRKAEEKAKREQAKKERLEKELAEMKTGS